MAAGGLPNQRLGRLKEALVAAGVVRGERDKTVAAATGYAEGSTRRLLAGSTPLTGRFIKAVCIKFNIRWQWIEGGEEPMIARNGESPYPGMEYDEQLSRITIGAGDMSSAHKSNVQPIDVRPYLAKFAGVEANITITQPSKPSEVEASGNIDSTCMTDTQQMSDTEYTMLLHEIRDKIKLYMTCVDTGGVLGWAAYINFLNMVMLPPHEMIDLVYQFRKLYDGDSDQLATAAADEKIVQSGIKPGITRLKIERISAKSKEEKQEK